jgi:VanZ like family
MRTIRLLICAGYWGLLSVLLLAPDPAAVVGLRRVPTFPWGDIGIHFTAFTILTLLVYGARWPKGIGWLFLAVLLAYGITTESLQWFVPSRAVELLDYTENILGIAAGTGIYWLAHRLIQQRRAAPTPVAELES